MKLNNETISLINFFENVTRAKVKDCFFDKEKIVVIVENGEMSKAIGKHGINIKKLEEKFKKKIKVVEFNKEVSVFIKNYIMPIKAQQINEENNIVQIKVGTTREKGILIGRDRTNIENLKEVVNKYFKITNIQVL